MKYLLFLVLIFSSQMIWAESNVPQAACIPENKPDWPVKAIYLHGWFESAGNGKTLSRDSEFTNRRHLEELANRLQIRIALPIAPRVNRRGMRTWAGTSLDQIEKLSSTACGGAPLAEDRSLIGYSNGGFAAKNIGQLPCEQLRAYRRILAIGTQRNYNTRCESRFKNIPRHEFPPEDLLTLTGQPLPPVTPAEAESTAPVVGQ